MTNLTLFLIGIVVLALLVLAAGLLRALSSAQADLFSYDGDGHTDREQVRGRLIASQERFRRQTDWQRPAAKGFKGDSA